jgi:hypothetical protein
MHGRQRSALEEANKILEEYRRTINKYLGWIMEKPERIRELENIYVVYGEDFIDDKIVGAISSILSTSLPNPEKPLIAYADVKEEGLVKVSARTVDAVTYNRCQPWRNNASLQLKNALERVEATTWQLEHKFP